MDITASSASPRLCLTLSDSVDFHKNFRWPYARNTTSAAEEVQVNNLGLGNQNSQVRDPEDFSTADG